ncbi:MAG: ATP-dependent helicase HrpB [Acidimicrobiales bacterium]
MTAPTGLPVEDVIGALNDALGDKGRAVLQAPPGAGKTTIVPLRLLDEPWLLGRILVLEPRRLATRAAARRMASLLDEPVGATVGYTTRDERHVSAATRIEVVTEGILTRRLQHDRTLPGVALVVFDEIHERNLHTDLALALTLHVGRDDLRLLAMSATIESDRVSALLNDAPIITSEGRQFPVDVRWVPPRPRQRLAEAAAATIHRALREQDGDVLVFLPGAGDIRRVERLLADLDRADVVVRPLFGALPVAEQDLALAPSAPGTRRVVLSTDIAETSLTVQGVRTVVDAGQARIPRYDARTGLSRLQTVTASRASADQRTGRAGRTGPGTAYRLWSRMEHAARRPFAAPEIELVDLTGLALELAVWGAAAADLAFLDPPPGRALDEAADLLGALGAIDENGKPTDEGRAMSELPLHPRLARMVTGARNATACTIAALLEDRDVLRGTPDEVPVDLVERVRLISDRRASHPLMDGAALSSARRRAAELARRIGARDDDGDVDLRSCGRVLALAYPDRIAQARGGARFRLRNGAGAWVPKDDPLASEAFLVVAELDADRRDSRVRMAAALDGADLEAAAGAPVETADDVAWDPATGEFRRTVTTRIDGLVLGSAAQTVAAADASALVEQVRANGIGVLPWTDAARSLQQRAGFLRRTFGDAWPDLSDAALLGTVDTWFTAGSLKEVDVLRVLGDLIHNRPDLDRLAPTALTVATGRNLRIDYSGEHPKAAGRVQDFYGTTAHPTIAGGRVPLVLELLSPANRPVQVTSDLPGFWAGSYAAVRKEMAGRYPKHPWPEDPAQATATHGRKPSKPGQPGRQAKPHRRRR